MLRKFLFWIAGDRPMRRIGTAFIDRVTGEPVHYFVDEYGSLWLATHRWSLFRIPSKRVQR
ncbi:hypothetical protein NKJ26_03190 [Mesorhizobium sp. M0152]|uniref:hypothetical protein n=1 Tax=Mesorhizobium sp. M0152 TaxID=2956898 RepID=UPI00333B8488